MTLIKSQLPLPSRDFQESFYDEFWTTPKYSSEFPNREELERLNAIKQMIDLTGLSNGKDSISILDLGCGRGWLTNLLAKKGTVLGVDLLESSVKHAKKLFPQLNFRVASTTELLNDSDFLPFDLIVCSEVIEHVPVAEQEKFIKEIFSLLKPNGYLVLTTPRGELWESRQMAFHKRNLAIEQGQPINDWLTERQLSEMSIAAGFTIHARTRAYYPNPPLNWHGMLRKYFLNRKYIRQIQIPWLSRWISYESKLYQILLVKRPPE